VGIFGFDDGKIFQVTVGDAPLNFQVGAISYFSQGAECRDVDFDGKPEFVILAIDGLRGQGSGNDRCAVIRRHRLPCSWTASTVRGLSRRPYGRGSLIA
jgi:hypothetical protein